VPVLYNLALALGSPFLLGYLLYRLVWRGKSREGLAERSGAAPVLGPPPPAGRLWLHAVSAGEMAAAAPVVRELLRRSPGTEVIVSATTPAGHAQAKRLIPGARAWFYFPFDFLPCVQRALARTQPTVVATVETEIWPNWLGEARRRGACLALLNGKFSDRGFRRSLRVRPLYTWALGLFDALLMQTETDGERAGVLGAPRDRVRVAGNTKFEQEVPSLPAEREAEIRASLGLAPGGPLWIAGSTHPGEEEQVLQAYRAARAEVPGLALLIAPRHIERAGEVAAAVEQAGFRSQRRTRPTGDGDAVILLDTIGELAAFYALADVVYVGGSLVPVGGHDVLQPLYHGKPTLFGPHMHNQRELAALTLAAGACLQVEDAADLARAVVASLKDPNFAARLTTASAALLAHHRGAAAAAAELLEELLLGR
jgi:3-deoxy-D-manno-octulosonic-acid transferase